MVKLIEVVCDNCGKKSWRVRSWAEKTTRHFCSRKCMGEWQTENWVGPNNPHYGGKAIPRTCKQCGNEFKVWRANLERGRGVFCSKKCQAEWQRKNWKGESNPSFRGKSITRHCGYCGKKFRFKLCEKREGRGRFCSKECHYKWRKETGAMAGEKASRWRGGGIVRYCEYCGREFRAKRSEVEKGKGKFCSIKCKDKWQAENLVGEMNPHWRGGSVKYYGRNWRKLRKEVLERDGYRCRICCVERGLVVHHKKKIKRFSNKDDANYMDNLVVACRSCHMKLEAGHLQLTPSPTFSAPSP